MTEEKKLILFSLVFVLEQKNNKFSQLYSNVNLDTKN